MRARFKVNEGDNECQRKVPTIKEMKVNMTTTSHASRHVVAYMPSNGTHGSKSVDNELAGESHTQQSHGSYDYEAQRARIKEIAAQPTKQL